MIAPTAEAPAGASHNPLVSKPAIAPELRATIETIREQMKNVKNFSYYNCCHSSDND